MSSLRHVEHCISRQQAYKHLNAFVSPPSAASVRNAAAKFDTIPSSSPLHGRLITLKDNIASTPASNETTTCASKVLHNYISPYPSTVATLLSRVGAIVAGKTNMDEFGMGSHSQTTHSGAIMSHLHLGDSTSQLSAGGSSGGAAVAVATGQCFAAIGTDTGGSVRLPAAWTGTVGFKPSYGRISRWGVVDYANSLDTVGVLARSVDDAAAVFGVLDAFDERDPTALRPSTRARFGRHAARTRRNGETLRIGVPKEWNVKGLQPEVRAAWRHTLDALQRRGHALVPVSLPSTPLALGAYYILAPAEASSNLARYDGIRYGFRGPGPDAQIPTKDKDSEAAVLYSTTRTASFGPEVRRRILLGTYTLSSAAMQNYFIAAQRVRRAVQADFDAVFALPNPLHSSTNDQDSGSVDVLLGPTAPSLPPTMELVRKAGRLEAYVADALTVPASLAGLPAASVPVAVPGLARRVVEGVDEQVWSAGMQVVGQFGDDEGVLEVSRLVEEIGNE
ncbi:hypothetical protein ANO11243_060380 [Dothideomycetidae sp. 11243]|nr:hypothetical protein ANO11243_060380 [fungal sp. No.11243]